MQHLPDIAGLTHAPVAGHEVGSRAALSIRQQGLKLLDYPVAPHKALVNISNLGRTVKERVTFQQQVDGLGSKVRARGALHVRLAIVTHWNIPQIPPESR